MNWSRALSTLSLYLFAKLGLRSIVAEDLGPPPKARKKGPAPPQISAETAAELTAAME